MTPDTTAPTTTDDVPVGFVAAGVVVTLTARDTGGSGLDRTFYTTGVNPADPNLFSAQYNPATKPTLGAGERIKYFYLAGNAEVVKASAVVSIATTPLPGPAAVTCLGRVATIVATPGETTVVGTSSSDVIVGSAAAETITGGGGNDRICAGGGNDRVSGQGGDDRLSGGSGKDLLNGGSGRDQISGGTNADRINGGSGNDIVRNAGGGADRVDCGAGTRDMAQIDRSDRKRRCERALQ